MANSKEGSTPRLGEGIQTGVGVLLAITELEEARVLLPLAEAVVRGQKGRLMILHVLVVPPETPTNEVATEASHFRESLSHLLTELVTTPLRIKTIVRPAAKTWQGIRKIMKEEAAGVLILSSLSALVRHGSRFTRNASDIKLFPFDVIFVRPGSGLKSLQGWKKIEKILIPVRGGPNSTLTLRVGYTVAQAMNAKITLLHAANGETEDIFIEEFSPVIRKLDQIERSVIVKEDVAQAILEEAKDHQAIVLGASSRGTETMLWVGEPVKKVLDGTDVTILVVKEGSKPESDGENVHLGAQTTFDRPVAVVVDSWFAEKTFHSREFSELNRLLALKEEQGLKISLGLPALNEEETVGMVIDVIQTALMEDVPLVDEMVLIDSGSEDRTREIAASLGVPVYIHQEILSQYGAFQGKGEALWKSLYVLSGDIVAWVDTDIKNIQPHFVYGLIGPLLRDLKIQYIKGFYRRPLRQGETMLREGGGRVTELTARPFINLFYPELSGLIQPLSGEYAGRRRTLERLPFSTGYGVEMGLLIDILEKHGLESIAQVDLLERIHHNQPLPSLSKMSFAIMQVVLNRLGRRHDVQLLSEVNLTMNLIRYGKRRRYYLEPAEVTEHERPAMITLPEYRQKRGLKMNESELQPGVESYASPVRN